MNILIILGHPDSNSFNHALAKTCINQLRFNGQFPIVHDLYCENFNPVPELVHSSNILEDKKLIEKHCNDLNISDGIVIIHPNWWGQPPAMVKGWMDRVLLPDVAYKFELKESGELKSVGLLKARTALVFNTSNTPEELENTLYKDPLETLWKNRIFKFCGIEQFERRNFRTIKDSSEIQRLRWLIEVQNINNYFPKTFYE